jgi:hypothetical protein
MATTDVVIELGTPMREQKIHEQKTNTRGPSEVWSEDSNTVNEWDKRASQTAHKWMENIKSTAFIYNFTMFRFQGSRRKRLMVGMIAPFICTLLSVIAAALGLYIDVYYLIGINIVNAIITSIAGIAIGTIRVNGWDDKIQDYNTYTERLGALFSTFELELDMSKDQRIDADDFIKRMHGRYLTLITQGPGINDVETAAATAEYNANQFKNMSWNNRYGKDINEKND